MLRSELRAQILARAQLPLIAHAIRSRESGNASSSASIALAHSLNWSGSRLAKKRNNALGMAGLDFCTGMLNSSRNPVSMPLLWHLLFGRKLAPLVVLLLSVGTCAAA